VIGRHQYGVLRVLGSPILALSLIAFVGVWSTLATIVPQGAPSAVDVAAWTAGRGIIGSVIDRIGLHQAFTALLLTLSTGICSWNRTVVAIRRSRALRSAAGSTRESVAARHDLEFELDPALTATDVLDRTAAALGSLGIKTRQTDGVVLAASSPWMVWGSPIFHWALVSLSIAAFAGVLLRAQGPMAIAVGDTKVDEPSSYLSLDEGAWHDFDRVHRSIRVESFEPGVVKDGVDLGAVPTVSVLDAGGVVLATQQVYPNNKLHIGSLSINAPDCGLTATLQLTAPSGSVLPSARQLMDFSQESTTGTIPIAPLVLKDTDGRVVLRMDAAVPLDRVEGDSFGEWIPDQPAAHVYVEDGSGAVLFDDLLLLGEERPLAGGGSIRLTDVGWYSLLSLVDDPSIPFVYASMIAAVLGLTVSLVGRQQLFAATIVNGADRRILAVRARAWRNAVATREEIGAELTRIFGSEQERSES